MVFQGISVFAMAIVSIGVMVYLFYKNREVDFYDYTTSRCGTLHALQQRSTGSEAPSCLGMRKRNMSSTEVCSICMEVLGDPDVSEFSTPIVSLPCEHLFHTACVNAWLITHRTCPNCRSPTSLI